MSVRLVSITAAGAVLASVMSPASVQAAGMVVYDPINAVHNAATAARALDSLSNQVRQLQNQALMLARSPLTQSGEIGQALSSMSALSKQVTGLAGEAATLEKQFASLYPDDLHGHDKLKLISDGLARLQAARKTAQDLARIAADLSGRSSDQQRRASAALTASEGAAGQTAAVQSSTQLMGVLAEQLASLLTLTAAQARLASEEAAREAADRTAAAEAHRRLWAHDSAKPTAPGFDPFARAQR